MAKTLKQFLEGYLKVKNPDEQKFVNKHVVAKHSDRNGNGDEVFNASKVKPIDRRKDRHGYNPGEDEKVYEAKIDASLEDELMSQRAGPDGAAHRAKKKLTGNQHKLDKNKNGKIDAHDFKLLRKEEAEQLDELSPDTLRRYRMKSKSIADNEGPLNYREKGRELAGRKTYGGRLAGVEKAKVMAKEEAEDLDEVLTAKTPMGTYIKDFEKSKAPQFKGKSKEKRRQMAIAAKLTAERGGKKLGEETEELEEAGYSAKAARAGKDIGKPGKMFAKIAASAAKKYGSKERGAAVAGAVLKKLRKEEALAELLADLNESHKRTMLNVFEKLNEENQQKFLEACETPEGVDQMLDFSINHRGE